MIHPQPWFERHFTFNLPVLAAPGVVERLRGTPARLHDRLNGLEIRRLVARPGVKWSIQENAGHLGDLEPLWMSRLEDISSGRKTLIEADLENRKTYEAGHNDRPLHEVLGHFRSARQELVAQLDRADEADWLRSSVHPRLKTPMRLLDLAFFVAEHDDHHLATITELLHWSA